MHPELMLLMSSMSAAFMEADPVASKFLGAKDSALRPAMAASKHCS
jgi:hypothetical protein